MGNAPYVGDFALQLSPGERRLLQSSPTKAQTAVRYVDAQGRKRTQGGPDLNGTQSYPLGRGAAHGAADLLWRQRAGAAPAQCLPPPAGLCREPRPWCLQDLEVGATLQWRSAAAREEALPLKRSKASAAAWPA